MVIDGIVRKAFVEQPMVQDSGPDPFEVSDANTILNYVKNLVMGEQLQC